tara:strand:- start:5175 stop:5585 length:411 start_codon:yes stop_codon:yes gene_type:complete
MKNIHHIGIVSENLDLVLSTFDLSKSKILETVDDDIQHNFLHFIRLNQQDPWIEIITPKNNESTVYNFSRKYKMGLHHIGILCENISEIESKFETNIDAVALGKYDITVQSFGGKISTLFIANHNMITEYVEIKNE